MTASKRQIGGGHYQKLAIQPSEFIQRNGLGWCEGNAIKYLTRHRSKNGRQDLEKAKHYIDLLIEWEYPDDGASHEPTREVPCDHVRDGLDPGLLSGVGRQGCPECDEP